jgi:hypothetical protein
MLVLASLSPTSEARALFAHRNLSLFLKAKAGASPCNPGVGLKITAPRTASDRVILDTRHSINNGIADLTERRRKQITLLSKRYETSKNPSTYSGIVLTPGTWLESSKPILGTLSVRQTCPTKNKCVQSLASETLPKAPDCFWVLLNVRNGWPYKGCNKTKWIAEYS